MSNRFDEIIDRRNSDSLKWNVMDRVFGRDDLIPMWVADMDFRVPDPVIEALRKRTEHGVFGYAVIADSFYESIMGWFERRYGWSIKKKWIVATHGVVPGLCTVLNTFTDEGDGVLIQPPVYYLFKDSVNANGRILLTSELVYCRGEYSLNLDELKEKAKEARMMILCSPHNPTGRVWTRGELKKIVKICAENEVFLFSDEIHADLVYPGSRHIPAGVLHSGNEGIICAYSTSKTFNLAGLELSVMIIPGKRTREKFQEVLKAQCLHMSNVYGIVATEAAYTSGDQWLNELMEYLLGNYLYVKDFLEESIRGISVIRPQATYLLWLDCSGLNMTDEQLSNLFVNEARLGLDAGPMFGPGGEGFMRMNIACPRTVLEEAMNRLASAVNKFVPLTN